MHRFLNCTGGYVRSVNTYSDGAAAVILPHVVGRGESPISDATTWDQIMSNSDMLVCFGGLPAKNLAVAGGGTNHLAKDYVSKVADGDAELVLVSPIRDDLPQNTEWLPVVPGSDVALMLAIAFVLVDENLLDREFLDRYGVGFRTFESYLAGLTDGVPKTPHWAEPLTGIDAGAIASLARRMALGRTMITMNWSLQRAEYGEQAPWMGVVLAAMLGQLGLPGGGFGHGYGSMGSIGVPAVATPLPTFPQGINPCRDFIPVARSADMLLNPGGQYDYNGERRRYPNIKLVYWCGGNPFHHHQDLARLRSAFSRPDTVIIQDPYWTAAARSADIVLPSSITLERDDIGAARNDSSLVAMKQALEPYGESRSDYEIFSLIAAHLGIGDEFTEGRSANDWVRALYVDWSARAREASGHEAPDFDTFWDAGRTSLPMKASRNFLGNFRQNPDESPLTTPSGRIEIFSETIASFGYDDCAGHPTWFEPVEWLGGELAEEFPIALIANQPRNRLHSQLDMGAASQAGKVNGRELIRINPSDASARGIKSGDIVRVYNDRGSCLATADVTVDVRPRVAQLPTGSWYDPVDWSDRQSMCGNANPNVLTRDVGTSRLAQGCTGQHTLVEVEVYRGVVPTVAAYDPPATVSR